MRTRSFSVLFLVCATLLNAGCGDSEEYSSQTNSESKGTIAVSILASDNPFFNVIADNITAEAKKNGYDTLVVSGDMDVARQSNQVKDFIVNNAAAIVLCPCDSKAIGPAIEEANAAGIPVFTTDIACLAPGAKVVCHVATDNLGGGREAGNAMIEALGEEGGKIIILDYKAAESCILRVQGFKEVIEKHNAARDDGKIDIVMELPGEGKNPNGFKATEDALQAHDDLVGIFAINDPSALGARAALEKAGKADAVTIVGFDGQPEGKQAIKDGKIYADPIQFPDKMGVETVKAIMRHFDGEEQEKEILIPTSLYRQKDGEADESLK